MTSMRLPDRMFDIAEQYSGAVRHRQHTIVMDLHQERKLGQQAFHARCHFSGLR